jgi:hypothetical protein
MFNGLNLVGVGRCLMCLVATVAVAGAGGCKSPMRPKNATGQPTSILGALSPPTPQEAAAWAVDPYDADKRYRGTLLLVNAPWGGEPVYVDLYARAIEDEDPSVKAAGARGLALHGGPEHVPLIVKHLADPDRLLRWECARALQRLHNPVAAPDLIKRLESKTEDEAMVRAASADALGQYAEPKVVDGLIAALADRDLTVHQAARRSLRTLTGQDLGADLRAWVTWKKQSPDLFAARQPYVYPVFERDKTWVEVLVPIFQPPNEKSSTPVGFDMTASAGAAPAEPPAPTEPAQDAAPSRNN